MDKKFGVYVLLGVLIGGMFESGLGAANGNTLTGLVLGALVGVFIGWFIGAAGLEKSKKEK